MREDEIKPFWRLVLDRWIWVVTSSTIAVILTVLGLFGVPIPTGFGWLILVIGIIWAIWLAGQFTHKERKRLSDQLKPKLEINPVPVTQVGICPYRITVRNLSSAAIRFGATLDAIEPPINHAVPVRLQLANTTNPRLEADIPGNGTHEVDVFIDIKPGNNLGLFLATHDCVGNNRPLWIPRTQYKIRICAFALFQAGAAFHSFYIIPQADGGIIFSDAG